MTAVHACVQSERLSEICSLLRQVADAPFALTAASSSDAEALAGPASGWYLSGGRSPEQLLAAARLVGRLFGAEEDLESLSSEILTRYEEANLVYRLSRGLATAAGERSIARIVVEEAAHTLDARLGELWLCHGETVALMATVPECDEPRTDLREQGPLEALAEGRAWLREASTGAEAVVAVPLPGPGPEPLGVLVLRGRSQGRSYRANEIKMLRALACLGSAFICNDRATRAVGPAGRSGRPAGTDGGLDICAGGRRGAHPRWVVRRDGSVEALDPDAQGQSCASLYPGDALVVCNLPDGAAPCPADGAEGPLAVARRWHGADARILVERMLEELERQLGGRAASELGVVVVRAADPALPVAAQDGKLR